MSGSTEQYEVIKKIGEGGMGIVYLARDTVLQRFVAIKELRNSSLQAEGNFADRFRQEAFALAQLNHKNITHIYAFVPYNAYYWMVMEYVEGNTLEEWISLHKNIPAYKASAIIEQVLAGLVHAHKKGIIHRDIKPANIIINEDDVKIMDFGIARINNNVKRLTSHGKTLGTLEYMAPEQIQGKEGNERSDIYAVGSIFYELLCGHPPFEKMPDFELMKAKLEKNAMPLSATGMKIPLSLQKVVMRSLERSPAQRYPTAQAFIDAIKECHLLNNAENEPGNKFLKSNVAAFKFSNPLKKIPQVPAFKKAAEKARASLSFKFSLPVLLLCVSALISVALLWWANTGKNNDTAVTISKSNHQYWENPVSAPEPEVTLASGATKLNSDSIPFNETPNEMLERISKKKDDGMAGDKPKIKDRIPVKAAAGNTPVEEESEHFALEDEVKYPVDRNRTARRVRASSNETVSLMLTESLSSEDRSRDGQVISLRVVNDVIVDGTIWIRKGATATGKIVDVVPANKRKKAVIGFVIRSITTTDGNEIKVSSPRYRNFATGLNEPVYFSSGQVFTVQTGRGRPRR
ncbi:serine/threonine protein kinase [Niabella aquatica]